MKNKKHITIVIAVGVIIGLVAAALIAASFTGAFVSVPRPEIKEGEFNFALTCEVDGEMKKSKAPTFVNMRAQAEPLTV